MPAAGARRSEIVNLTASRIVLDAEVPCFRMEAEGRDLKTERGGRDIPLVGYRWRRRSGIRSGGGVGARRRGQNYVKNHSS